MILDTSIELLDVCFPFGAHVTKPLWPHMELFSQDIQHSEVSE